MWRYNSSRHDHVKVHLTNKKTISTHVNTTERPCWVNHLKFIANFVLFRDRLLTVDSIDFIINLLQEFLIDRFYHIDVTKTYNIHAQILGSSASYEILARMRYSLFRIALYNEQTTFCYAFLSSDLQYSPPSDPIIIFEGLRLLANHSCN